MSPRRKRKKALFVANPVARGVTPAMVDVIGHALADGLDVELFRTTGRGSARDAAAEAVANGVDVVVVFSGDGTINEVVNGMVGSGAALGLIPGGATNVLARNLGLSEDALEATSALIARAAAGEARRLNVGSANGRCFVINCGAGVDAALMRKVEDASPRSRTGHERAAIAGALGITRDYVGRRPDLTVKVDDRPELPAVSVLVARTSPYAYFKSLQLKIHPEPTELDGGLEVLSVRRLPAKQMPRIAYEIFTGGNLASRPEMDFAHDASVVEIGATHPFPVQLDGEYVGEHDALHVEVLRDALWVLA